MGNSNKKQPKTCKINSELIESSTDSNTIIFVKYGDNYKLRITLNSDSSIYLDYDKLICFYENTTEKIYRACRNVRLGKLTNLFGDVYEFFSILYNGKYTLYYIKFNKLHKYTEKIELDDIDTLSDQDIFKSSTAVFTNDFEIRHENIVYSDLVK